MARTTTVIVVAACGAAFLGCGSDDDKTVAGRTSSTSTAAETSWGVELRRERLVEAATGAVSGRFQARVEAPRAEGAALRTPRGEELPLERVEGVFVLREEGPAATLEERFPAGGYTFLLDLAAGRDVTGTLLARELPAPPTLLAPLDRTLLSADEGLLVRWGGLAARHDLRLVVVESGQVVHEVRGLLEGEHRVSPGVLVPGQRHRLEVLAVEGPAQVRAAAGVSLEVDVASQGPGS